MTRVPGIGVLTTDVDLTVRSWNGWLAQRTGVAAEAACGRRLTDVVPDLARHDAFVRAALRDGVTSTLSSVRLGARWSDAADGTADGSPVHARLGPLRSDGHITGVLLTLGSEVADGAHGHPLAGLRGERWQSRRAAVTSVGPVSDAALVTEVLKLLRDEHADLDVATSALAVLANTDVDVVDTLVDVLGETDAELRAYAALLLGHRHDQRAVNALLSALDDADANVRFHVVESLGRLEAREAAERLVAIAEAADFFLAFPALSALARVGDGRVAPRLVPLLAVPILSEAAAEALGQLGSHDAIAPLLGMLDGADPPVGAVVSAIDRLAERDGARDSRVPAAARAAMTPARAQTLIDAVHQVGVPARPLARVLGWLEGLAVARALTRMLGRAEARAEAVDALVAAGPRVVDMLLHQLGAEDLETRSAAVVALGKIRDARAVPALLDALRDAELTPLAIAALGAIGDARAFVPLAGLLSHEAAAVRQAAVSAVAAVGHPDAERHVLGWLDAADPRLREAGVKLVARLAPRISMQVLRRGCLDAVDVVRRSAVSALADLADAQALTLVLDALGDGAPAVRAAAVRTLGEMKPTSSAIAPALLRTLDDGDDWVRYFAARALARREAEAAVPALTRLTREDPAPQVRIAAAEALSVIGGNEARVALASLTGSANPDLARVAREATSVGTAGPAGETC
jgi:HEAT repeat protein